MLTIKTLSDDRKDDWDRYVNTSEDASFFHLSGWARVLEQAFGHRTYFLFVEDDSGIQGILPLAHVKSLLFGNALISTPFCVIGGIVSSTDEAYRLLRDRACELAEELKVDYLEMRNACQREVDWPGKDLYVNFSREITDDDEKNMQAIPRKQRAMVRKGIKAGLHGREEDGVDNLYEAYSQSVRNLGTPVFGKKYLSVLQEVFSEQVGILSIWKDEQLVGSVMSFYFRDRVMPYYGGGTAAARQLKGNDFMYWELMHRSAARDIRVFDYGRSKKGSGSFSFKKNWGFEPEPLYYEYYLVKSSSMPELNPNNPKYALFISIWKRLPFYISRLIGPFLARSLG